MNFKNYINISIHRNYYLILFYLVLYGLYNEILNISLEINLYETGLANLNNHTYYSCNRTICDRKNIFIFNKIT